MLTLQPELEELRGTLGDRITDALIAREDREVFSIQPELRLIAWAGAMLLATAAGIVLKDNLAEIGPIGLAMLMGLAAVACYAYVWWHRARASLVDDYILLLGALLVSGDVAFIETQFHLMGSAPYRQFLVVAVLHGLVAYLYRSRVVLSLSVAALAAWLGIERRSLAFSDSVELAMRGFIAAALVLVWHRLNRVAAFAMVFEHAAANLALVSSLALTFNDRTRLLGCAIALAVAAIVIVWGFRTHSEPFVLYAFLYALVAIDTVLIETIGGRDTTSLFIVVLSMIGAIVALFAIHARFREVQR